MTRLRIALGLALALLLVAGTASAQEKRKRVPMNVLVTEMSNHGSGIDRDAKRLDEKLSGQFKYDSLRVLEKRRIDPEVDGVESIRLPNGRAARVQPIHTGSDGVLMAVDVEDAAKIDARVKEGNLLVIRAGKHGDGDLVLSIEPAEQ
ncbi:MAG: hypothetical protein ACQGVC_00335 [Myxococcota bacterium]